MFELLITEISESLIAIAALLSAVFMIVLIVTFIRE